jgi:hypothetical protein
MYLTLHTGRPLPGTTGIPPRGTLLFPRGTGWDIMRLSWENEHDDLFRFPKRHRDAADRKDEESHG